MTSARQQNEEQFLIEKIDCLIKFFSEKKNHHESAGFVRHSILGEDLNFNSKNVFIQVDKEKFLNNNPGEQICLFVNFLNKNKFDIKQENYTMSKQTLMDLSDKEVCSFASSNRTVSIIQDLKKIKNSMVIGDEINKVTFVYKGEEDISNDELKNEHVVKFCINGDYLNEGILTNGSLGPIKQLIDLCLKKVINPNKIADAKKALNSGRGRIYMKGSYKKTEIIVTERGQNVLSDKIIFEFISTKKLNSRRSRL